MSVHLEVRAGRLCTDCALAADDLGRRAVVFQHTRPDVDCDRCDDPVDEMHRYTLHRVVFGP